MPCKTSSLLILCVLIECARSLAVSLSFLSSNDVLLIPSLIFTLSGNIVTYTLYFFSIDPERHNSPFLQPWCRQISSFEDHARTAREYNGPVWLVYSLIAP